MSFELTDLYSDGSSSCCDALVIDPSGENVEGRCDDCGEMCSIVTEESYMQECKDIGEHMKHIYSEDGFDKCYNCGGKE